MSYKNINEFDTQANKAIEAKTIKALNELVGGSYPDEVKNRIVKRTQLGIGVDTDGNAYKLPALSDNYKEMRQGKSRWYTAKNGARIKVDKANDSGGFVKKPKIAGTTTPAKSNMTATGQLLKSLTTVKLKLTDAVGWSIRVGARRGLGLFGYPSSWDNKQIVSHWAANGRRFLGLTKSQKNQISREIRQIMIKFLR